MPTHVSTSDELIDTAAVRRYFDGVGASASAASSMAHERTLPPAANLYRKQRELMALRDWLDGVPSTARMLDVGCGAGNWAEIFATRCREVVAIDQSVTMIESARQLLAGADNVSFIIGDIRTDLPAEHFDLIFVGGVCMYLNDDEVEALLRSLCRRLAPRGFIILRESTVRRGRRIARGEYQAIYRTVERYRELCDRADARVLETRLNKGYESFEIGADIAEMAQLLPLLADSTRLSTRVWYLLKATAPLSFGLLPRFCTLVGIEWPRLQNHFFRVEP
jgi:SAM-dependent methyltransferase